MPAELVEILGRARIEQNRAVFDSIAQSRVIAALDYPPARLAEARARQAVLRDAVCARMRGLDGWITPTTPLVPGPLAHHATLDAALAWNRRALRNTRIGNVFEQCAISLPLTARGGGLPVGLQIVCPALEDAKLLALAVAAESVVGRAALPEVETFAGGAAAGR